MKYRAEIDGLRAVAVVSVILCHAGIELFSGGFAGVDVFFVISGYLITSILIEDLARERFSIVNFYERRARRILPALFLVMFACLPFAWLWMWPDQMTAFLKSVVAVTLFCSNFFFWSESGYFAEAAEAKPLLHTWSLAVEEQFYVLFPVFLYFAWRYARAHIAWMIVAFAVPSFLLSEWGWRHMESANFYLAPARAWELLAGALCAFVVRDRGVQSNNALSLFGLAAVVFTLLAYDQSMPFPSVFTLLPVGGVVLLVLYAGEDTYAGRLLSTRVFVGTGLISYSAYLWHQPLFAFARIQSAEKPSEALMLKLSLLSIGLAVLSWRYVEQPFRGTKALLRSKPALWGSALAGVLVFGLIAAHGHMHEGYEGRFSKVLVGDVSHEAFHAAMDGRFVDCEPAEIAREALSWGAHLRCKQSRPGVSDWVLLGDSHAEHLFPGLAEASPSRNIVYYINNNKPYVGSAEFKAIFDVLLAAPEPKTVFLTMHYVVRLQEVNDLSEGFGSTIRALQGAGHEVILLGAVPTYDMHPRTCLYDQSAARAAERCSIGKTRAVAQVAIYEDALKLLGEELSVSYYPVSEPFCDDERCSMVRGDTILYRDTNHLNLLGSRLAGKYLAGVLESQLSKL